MNSNLLLQVCPKRNLSVTNRRVLGLILCLLLFGNAAQADIIINGYTAATNDRFTNSGAFIGSGLNFSGVGQTTGARWATAISRNVVISAWHFPPTGTVNFYANNDPSGIPVTRNVVSGLQVPNTDLYLAVLDSNLPTSITHYSFATEAISGPPLTLSNAGIYQNMNAYMVGRSPEPHPGFRDQAVGRNRITSYVENVNFLGLTDADSLLLFYDSTSNPNFVQYEAYLQGGDSGGPMFVDFGGNLRLLGINSFINFGGINANPAYSGISYTGNQAAFIQAYIAANSIPEPSALALILVGCLIPACTRRRGLKR